MKKIIKKITTALLCLTTFFSCNMFVSASESNNATTAFTQELAGEIGLKVAETVTNSDNITVNKTIGFYDTAGYVILDTSMEDLVSEFTLQHTHLMKRL